MSKVEVQIWNRTFELIVSYQNFPGEDVTDNQQKTLETVPTVEYNPAKAEIEKYVRKYFSTELGNDSMDNIFRFVMPKSVLIPRTEKCVFAIMCKFKLDMEHGIAIVYENGILKEVGPQDIIL